MPVVGDRLVFEGVKVGEVRREGECVAVVGRAVRVRWADGTESLLVPGPGSMRVVGSGRPTEASGTIRASAKKGSSKRTAQAGGDFTEAAPSGVSRESGAARGAGKAGGSRAGAGSPAAGRGSGKTAGKSAAAKKPGAKSKKR